MHLLHNQVNIVKIIKEIVKVSIETVGSPCKKIYQKVFFLLQIH